MESFFPSAGNYKINVQINGVSLDVCSFAMSSDRLRVSFDESVSSDPDVTSLIVFLRDDNEELTGWKVIYQLDPDNVDDTAEENLEENSADKTTDKNITSEKSENSINASNASSDQNDSVSAADNADNKNSENKNDDKNDIEKDNKNDIESTEKDNSENKNDNESDIDKEIDAAVSEEISAKAENVDVDIDKILQVPVNYKSGDEIIVLVKSFDKIPYFPIPNDLPIGRYTIVSNIMSNDDVLQRVEKSFFYLGGKKFAYNGISVNLPGIADSNQLIPKGTVIMLEAEINYDVGLDPYIEWYNGRKKIAEGKYSDGAGYLLWKAPEESGFYSIRAVVFPIENFKGLSGYQKEVSLLVSAKPIDMHLISEDDESLKNRYIFEGNLIDSKTVSQAGVDFSLKHDKDDPKWKASNGTYGAVTGNSNVIRMSAQPITNKDDEDWKLLFRFKPENDGGILSVRFSRTLNIFMHLYIEGSNLVLTLSSPAGSVSQIYNLYRNPVNTASAALANISPNRIPADQNVLPDKLAENELLNDAEFISLAEEAAEPVNEKIVEGILLNDGSFFVAGIKFSYRAGILSAQLNILGDHLNNELTGNPISLKVENINEFQIMLGFLRQNILPADVLSVIRKDVSSSHIDVRHEFTAIWDEFALYYGQKSENDDIKSDETPTASSAVKAIEEVDESSPAEYN